MAFAPCKDYRHTIGFLLRCGNSVGVADSLGYHLELAHVILEPFNTLVVKDHRH